MKSFDFYSLYAALRRVEGHELIRVLNRLPEHKYEWEKGEGPIVNVELDSMEPEPENVAVRKVHLDEYGLHILVHEKYGGEDVEIETSDLLPGQLHYLTEYMECDVPLDEEFPIQVAETLSKAVAMASRDYYKSISDK